MPRSYDVSTTAISIPDRAPQARTSQLRRGATLEMTLLSVSRWSTDDAGVPEIDGAESFADLVDKLSQ